MTTAIVNATEQSPTASASPHLTFPEISTLVVMSVVTILSLVGNLLVIGAAYIRESLRTPNNLFLVNLAVADLGQGIVAIPLRMTEIFNRGTDPLVPCLFVLYVTILFFGVSMITVAWISIDRFLAIRHPFVYLRLSTRRNALICIGSTWFFMAIFSGVPYLGAAVEPPELTKVCLYSHYLSQVYLLTMFSVVNFLIIVILVFTNTLILKASLRQITKIKAQVVPMAWTETDSDKSSQSHAVEVRNRGPGSSPFEIQNRRTRARYHRELKATRVTLAVVSFTIVLTTPIMVIDLVSIWCPTCSPSIVTRVSIAMAYANSCVNPWIFAGFNTIYRETYIEVLKRLRNFLLCKNI